MPALHNADQEQLQKLLLGQLSTADVERLATEYADDGRLAELAESLTGQDDALLALLHNHQTAIVDPEGERLVERLLQRLKPAIPTKPRDDTADMNRADVTTEPSSPNVTTEPQPLPERLEHYRPIKVLGQGGMGTVYLAEDTRLGREVAIKTLRPELAINPQAKERFLREARAAAKLEHDNIIPIYSVGEAADGTPFLAMPLLKGSGANAITDAEGRYRLQVPSPGIYNVWLKKFDQGSTMTAAADDGLLVEAGKVTPSQLFLVKARKVAGKVEDSDGKPCADLSVSCNSATSPQAGDIQSVKSNGDGSFEFVLPPGRAYFNVYESVAKTADNRYGLGRHASAHVIVSATDVAAPITLTLRELPQQVRETKFGDPIWLRRSTPGTQIVSHEDTDDVTGTVVDVADKPIAGAKVIPVNGPINLSDDKGAFKVRIDNGT